MKKELLIEKVAAGLRKMEAKPDYFLFIDQMEIFTWDEDSICGIPVIHTHMTVNPGYDGDQFSFHPCWNKESINSIMQVHYFQKGFTEMPHP